MTTQHSIQYQRHRKFLLVLPLILISFLALAFYALGGGKTNSSGKQSTISQGLNTSLPGAQFDKHEKAGDKMSFYQQAKQDSDRAKSAAGNTLLQKFGFKQNEVANSNIATVNSPLTTVNTDPTVVRINQKLAAINKQISQPQAAVTSVPANKPATDKTLTEQVNKLEAMMKAMNASQGSDPQMQQLSKMLAQIQEIQHPELAKAKITPATASSDSAFRAIPAIIDGNQKVLQGGAVKLKLNDTIRLKGHVIPKGTLLFGNCTITNQRLLLEIKNIRLGTAIIPVDLSVYSMDGIPGIPAPEAEIAGAAGSGADNALESMQFLSMDQSLATQAAAGGIQAAKGLFSKKVRRVKVKLKGGFPLLLKINRS